VKVNDSNAVRSNSLCWRGLLVGLGSGSPADAHQKHSRLDYKSRLGPIQRIGPRKPKMNASVRMARRHLRHADYRRWNA